MQKIYRLYLDNCCLNRPFDNQEQLKIKLETKAKLYIQHAILIGKYENENNKYTYSY
jgi:hypothetical protein